MRDLGVRTGARSAAGLRAQVGAVVHDVPALLTAPLYRSRHLVWGATRTEQRADLPGDGLLPAAQYKSTRAITINAPPEAIWPWLVQVGWGRAGFYSHDLLDNLARPSAETLSARVPAPRVGQWVPMSPAATPRIGRRSRCIPSKSTTGCCGRNRTAAGSGNSPRTARRDPPGDPRLFVRGGGSSPMTGLFQVDITSARRRSPIRPAAVLDRLRRRGRRAGRARHPRGARLPRLARATRPAPARRHPGADRVRPSTDRSDRCTSFATPTSEASRTSPPRSGR